MNQEKALRERINSVEQTRKITNAMYAIANTKLRWATRELSYTRPYFDALRDQMMPVFQARYTKRESRWFLEPGGGLPSGGDPGLLIITADRGLAGAYNMNVLREALRCLEAEPHSRIFVVGQFGRGYCLNRGLPMEPLFFPAEKPSVERARDICTQLLDRFENGKLNSLRMVYTDMRSRRDVKVRSPLLLPLERGEGREAQTADEEFEFEPSFDAVLDDIIRGYLIGYIYSALISSWCAEQDARVEAMETATRSADDLLSELRQTVRRARQTNLTREINEVSAGALAQRQELERRKGH